MLRSRKQEICRSWRATRLWPAILTHVHRGVREAGATGIGNGSGVPENRGHRIRNDAASAIALLATAVECLHRTTVAEFWALTGWRSSDVSPSSVRSEGQSLLLLRVSPSRATSRVRCAGSLGTRSDRRFVPVLLRRESLRMTAVRHGQTVAILFSGRSSFLR